MEITSKEIVIPARGVRSLTWLGTTLVDWVSGAVAYELDGTTHPARIRYGYRFDAALVSSSGALVAIYERLGTKALLVRTADRGLVREFDRSYYQAGAYEFPIAFVTLPDGSEGIAHCPQEYCRIDIDDALFGRCLTDQVQREPSDFFHSRLLQSPGGRWLASAGWIWHPLDVACLWDVQAALENPRLLDRSQIDLAIGSEAGGLTFLDDQRLVVGSGGESPDNENVDAKLVVIDPLTGDVTANFALPAPAGTLHRWDDDLVLSLFKYPKLIRISDGTIVKEWPHLATGDQNSSIMHHIPRLPAFALQRAEQMFAVADEEKITVVRLR